MSGREVLPFVEYLGIQPVLLTNPDQTIMEPAVLLSIRPEPTETWRSFSFPMTIQGVQRLRDDLGILLQEMAQMHGR